MSSQQTKVKTLSPETQKLVEAVLDFIRANLNNIRNALGEDSPQYKAAAEIMEKHLNDNLKRLELNKSDISDLMSGLAIKDDE